MFFLQFEENVMLNFKLHDPYYHFSTCFLLFYFLETIPKPFWLRLECSTKC